MKFVFVEYSSIALLDLFGIQASVHVISRVCLVCSYQVFDTEKYFLGFRTRNTVEVF